MDVDQAWGHHLSSSIDLDGTGRFAVNDDPVLDKEITDPVSPVGRVDHPTSLDVKRFGHGVSVLGSILANGAPPEQR